MQIDWWTLGAADDQRARPHLAAGALSVPAGRQTSSRSGSRRRERCSLSARRGDQAARRAAEGHAADGAASISTRGEAMRKIAARGRSRKTAILAAAHAEADQLRAAADADIARARQDATEARRRARASRLAVDIAAKLLDRSAGRTRASRALSTASPTAARAPAGHDPQLASARRRADHVEGRSCR